MKTIFLVSLIIITSLSPIFGQNPTGTFTDSRDGHVYKTVTIGTQTWMAENLAYLPSVNPASMFDGLTPYYYVYGYNGTNVSAAKETTNYDTYGVLFNWSAAATACPSGWHLPSDDEWKILEKNLGMIQSDADALEWRNSGSVGGKLKESGTNHWGSPNTGASNSSGFTALPGGYCYIGSFDNLGSYARFWSVSTDGIYRSWFRGLDYSFDGVNRYSGTIFDGISVRCLQNNITATLQFPPSAPPSNNPPSPQNQNPISITRSSNHRKLLPLAEYSISPFHQTELTFPVDWKIWVVAS